MTREAIFATITAERARQQAKWGGKHDWGHGDCSGSGVLLTVKLAVLAEEFGEVARAVLERDPVAFGAGDDPGCRRGCGDPGEPA